MEPDSGQAADSSGYKTASTSKAANEPSRSHISSPDVSASPLGKSRYGRTRKPKISEDFYNIDVIFETARELKKSPRATPQLKSPTSKSAKPQHNQSPLNKLKVNSSLTAKHLKPSPKSKNFVHVTGDTVVITDFASPTAPVTTSKESLSPVNSKTIRKFFKRESGSTLSPNAKDSADIEHCLNTEGKEQKDAVNTDGRLNSDIVPPTEDSLSLETVDVTKVLKIISVKSSSPLQSNPDTKGNFKTVLKTYSNKRKNFQKGTVVESFGLPDKPIFPLESEISTATNEPKRIKNLDVAAPSSESDINIVDKKLLDTPWKIASMSTGFCDNENLIETCEDSPEENEFLNEAESSILLKNKKQTVSEESFTILEVSENINDNIKSNKTNILRKESPRKQKKVTSGEYTPTLDSSGNSETQGDMPGKTKISKNNTVKKDNYEELVNTPKAVSKSGRNKILSPKGTIMSRNRSPKKQKEVKCKESVTVSVISSENLKRSREIKTNGTKTFRTRSPQKQKQIVCDEYPTLLDTVNENFKNNVLAVNESPKKQKHEESSQSYEVYVRSENKKSRTNKTTPSEKPTDAKKQKRSVSAETPLSSRTLRSINTSTITQQSPQKRQRSLSLKRAADLHNLGLQRTPKNNRSPLAQTSQRKSPKSATKALENLNKKEVESNVELSESIKNDGQTSKETIEGDLARKDGHKKSKTDNELNSQHLEQILCDNDDISQELDEMNLLERVSDYKSKICLNSKLLEKGCQDDITKPGYMNLVERSRSKKFKTKLHMEQSKEIINDKTTQVNKMNLNKRRGKSSKTKLSLKHSKEDEICVDDTNAAASKVNLLEKSRGKTSKTSVGLETAGKVEDASSFTNEELDEMSLLSRKKLLNESSVNRRRSRKRVLVNRDCGSLYGNVDTSTDLVIEIKKENDENDNSAVEVNNSDDKKFADECRSLTFDTCLNEDSELKVSESRKTLYDLQIKVEPKDVELGDLMWAKIGCHPYWPCLISEDPITKEFKAIKKHVKYILMSYHVRFFGDRGRRSWVTSASVIRFTDKTDLKVLHERMKSKTSAVALLQPFIVRPNALARWENAVAEAESLKFSTAQERLDFFLKMFTSEEERTKSTPMKKEKPNTKTKPLDVSEIEVKEETFELQSPVTEKQKPSRTPKPNVPKKKLHQVLLNSGPAKLGFRKLSRTGSNSRSKLKLESLKQARSKSLPLAIPESTLDENISTFKAKPENVKLKATSSIKTVPSENDILKPVGKGVCKPNVKNDFELSAKPLPLSKRASKAKERQESRENSIDEPPETFLKNPWQVFDMPKRHLSTPLNEVNSECSLSDSDSLSKSSSNAPVASTYKAQIARQKRNSLFRGIPRHRVCQVCKKPSEILKCKGPCSGLFHYECSNRPRSDPAIVVLKKESCPENESCANKNGNFVEDNGTWSNQIPDTNGLEKSKVDVPGDTIPVANTSDEKAHEIQSLTKVPINNHEKDTNNSSKLETVNSEMISEEKAIGKSSSDSKYNADHVAVSDKVEIIHIDCDDSDFEHSLTPKVRLTPSTDFNKLSLAEQIDIKMKEVMQEFEKNTRYADSTTDYTSSEESTSNILPAIQKPKAVQKKKSPKIKHVTADHVSFVEYSSTEDLVKGGSSTDDSQEIISSQGITSSVNSECLKPDVQKSESSVAKDVKSKIQKNKAQTTEENKDDVSHVIGDTQVDCEPSNEVHSVTDFKCGYCMAEIEPPCFVCNKEISSKNESFRQKCSLHMCGKFYHPECLKMWPQTQWSLISSAKHKNSNIDLDTFVCPVHVCHTCASDNPHAAVSRCTSDKVVKCLHCPATYHTTNYCVPAGTVILSTSQIICPRHLGQNVVKKGRAAKCTRTINTPWCFICSKGGDLICCETCPTSVHTDCLQINLLEDGTFICEDCETGRFPLYDEIVWVKLGAYRWWPAVILFPNEVPDNIKNIPHNKGEFVVKFFGTHDHYWVHRGRVFLFQEGDMGHCSPTRRRVDALFKKSIEEAAAAHHFKKVFKMNKEAEIRTGMKPPPYIRVKVNKPVGNVRLFDGNISNTTSCECDPNQVNPCGADSDCLNRLLLTECDPNICPAKEKCNNQRFEKRQYPPLVPFKTPARGWGLRTLVPIRKGDFVIEYVGEIIDEQEYQRRIRKMHEQKDENYYFLTIDKDRIIDAGPKGNLARFMNHCCQPNCETQKWTVNGDTRVGLFAVEDIPADAELTFNYNLECIGKEKKICKCGAPNCSGFIGVKAKVDESQKKPKKNNSSLKKKKQPLTLQVLKNDGPCFVCGQLGDVGACNNKICTKFYHLQCVNLEFWPDGKWVCPWHNCNVCSKRTIRCCVKCINSYCPVHSEGNVRYDRLLGFICSEHDPTKESPELSNPNPAVNPKSSTVSTTEETDVTSTTPDEIDSNSMQISESINEFRSESPDLNLGDSVTSTPIKNKEVTSFVHSPGDCENCLTADTIEDSKTDIPEEQPKEKKSRLLVSHKRKRGRSKPSAGNSPKKIKLSSQSSNEAGVESKSSYTTSNLLDTRAQNEVKLSSSVPTRHLRTTRNNMGSSAELKRFLNRQSELEKDLPIRKRSRPRCEATL